MKGNRRIATWFGSGVEESGVCPLRHCERAESKASEIAALT